MGTKTVVLSNGSPLSDMQHRHHITEEALGVGGEAGNEHQHDISLIAGQ